MRLAEKLDWKGLKQANCIRTYLETMLKANIMYMYNNHYYKK